MRALALVLLFGCATDPGRLRLSVDRMLLHHAKSLAPRAPAVILEEKSYLSHEGSIRASTVYEHYRATLINSEAGFSHASVHVEYPDGATLVNVEATIHLPDGRSIEVDPRDMFDHETSRTAGEEAFVGRALSFSYPNVVAGAILEHRYVIEYGGFLTELREEVPHGVPVISARHQARLHRNLVFAFDQRGFELDKQKDLSGGLVVTWRLSQPYLPLRYEPHSDVAGRNAAWVSAQLIGTVIELLLNRSSLRIGPKVEVTWEEISRLLRSEVAQDHLAKLPELAATSTSVLGLLEAAVERVEKTVDIRQPLQVEPTQSLDAIVARGYGSPWQAVRLLRALLKREHFDVRIVIVPTSGMSDPIPTTPSFEIMRGAPLLWIEEAGHSVWLDLLCPSCGMGQYLPQYQGRSAVVFHEERGGKAQVELVTMPWQWAPGGEVEENFALDVHSDRIVVKSGVVHLRGALAALVRGAVGQQPVGLDRKLRAAIGLELAHGTVKLARLPDRSSALRVEIEGATLDRANFVSTPDRFWFSLADAFPCAELEGLAVQRKGPLRYETRPDFRRTLTIEAKDGRAPKRWPKPVQIDDVFGTYRLEVSAKGTQLQIRESFTLKQPEIEVSMYPRFRVFGQRISAARGEPIGFGL